MKDGQDFHFFASSFAEWRADEDVRVVIKYMEKQKIPYNLWMIPLDNQTGYEINYYQPQVEGAVYLGHYK
ncbi:hypothetical protein EBU24_02605 [bacterium]|nr:hypothetical protein [bacterium]